MRLLCFQNQSVFEGHGGIEYYLDDWLQAAAHWWPGQVRTLVPHRESVPLEPLERPYSMASVPIGRAKGIRGKLLNRFHPRYLKTALSEVKAFKPELLVCGHTALGPLVAAVSYWTKIPYATLVYGVEAWGDLLPPDEWALRRSTQIFSISEWTRRILIERGYRPEKIQIIHPHLDPRLLDRPAPALKPGGPLRLLSVSRLCAQEQYKGQDHALRALALLRQTHPGFDFVYTIHGEGTDRPRLERLAKEYRLETCVRFTGRCADRIELESLYKEADLFLLPSRFGRWEHKWRGEGFGIVYLEAAALGVPSLAYAAGGVMDIVEHGKTGWLVPNDGIAELAKALIELGSDRAKLHALGLAAQVQVNTRFTPAATAHQLKTALAITRAAAIGRSAGSVKVSQSPPHEALTQSPP